MEEARKVQMGVGLGIVAYAGVLGITAVKTPGAIRMVAWCGIGWILLDGLKMFFEGLKGGK